MKEISRCFGSLSRIKLTACINRHGYTPGDRIAISLDLENQSDRKVTRVSAILLQEVKYEGKKGGVGKTCQRNTTRVAKGVTSFGCRSNDSVRWNEKAIIIPPIPPTGLQGCPFIDIQYFLKVQAFISGTTSCLEVNFPVIVKTVPASRLLQENEATSRFEHGHDVVRPLLPPYSDDGVNYTTCPPPPPAYQDLYSESS